MKIGIDARFPAHGVGRYVRELLLHLPALAPQHEFYAITSDAIRYAEPLEFGHAPNLREHRLHGGLHHPRSHLAMAAVVAREKTDLFHATSYARPLVLPCPVLTTIHDLCLLQDPSYFPPAGPLTGWLARRYYRAMNAYALHASRRIVTVSQFARQEILDTFPRVPPARVEVVYHGVGDTFRPASREARQEIRARYGLPPRFLLFVGTVNPRKNLSGILDALELLAARGDWSIPLVAVARTDRRYAAFYRRLETFPHPSLIKLLDYVPSPDLPAIYSAADALVFPSFHESFGFPVVESFACELPVLTSNGTALREIAGHAALLVDPHSPHAIADGCRALVEDAALRRRLIDRGLQRARDFTWPAAAKLTLAQYEAAVK